MALPYDLRQEFLKGNLVLFVGAGFVKNYLPNMPLWQELLQNVFRSLRNDPNEIYKYCDPVFNENGNRVVHSAEYLRLAQQFELVREGMNANLGANGEREVLSIHEQIQHALTETYDPEAARQAVRDSHLMAASGLPIPIWVTTNYDTFLEDTVFEKGVRTGSDTVLSRPIRNVDFGGMSGGGRTLLKIHGSISNSEPGESIVITEEDYYRFLRQDRYIINKLYTLFCERTVLFLGYGLSDPNIQFIYHEVLFDQKAGGGAGDSHSFSQIRPSFFVSPHLVPPEQKAYYKHKRIQYIEKYSIEKFFEELSSTFATFERGRADITAKIRGDVNAYVGWYNQVSVNVDPDALGIEDDQKIDALSQMLDLVELNDLVYQPKSASIPLEEFEEVQLRMCVHGIQRVTQNWCEAFLEHGRTDLLELILNFLQYTQRVRKSDFLRLLLRRIAKYLEEFPGIHDIDRFIQRYCALVRQYDVAYNDWDDYTFCLDCYVRATRLFANMPRPTQRHMMTGLYEQLSMCGRGIGDSWYTTNYVYTIWPLFNPQAWPLLEAEIRRNGVDAKGQLMLEHLRPGGDCNRFLPRY